VTNHYWARNASISLRGQWCFCFFMFSIDETLSNDRSGSQSDWHFDIQLSWLKSQCFG